jgi:hypothetical protein
MTAHPEYPPYPVVTASGRLVDLAHPDLDSICVEDIAHALSHLCRYSGMVREFYSVAQHCVLVSHHPAVQGYELEALLHDAAEAYTGDLTVPMAGNYRLKAEWYNTGYNVVRAIDAVFTGSGDPFAKPDDLCGRVNEADRALARAEMRDLFPPGVFHPAHTASDLPPIVALPPLEARALFLARYEEVKK